MCQGVAFEDIGAGEYYPAVSLYMGAEVSVNFGPDFIYTPTGVEKVWCAKGVDEEAVLDNCIYSIGGYVCC